MAGPRLGQSRAWWLVAPPIYLESDFRTQRVTTKQDNDQDKETKRRVRRFSWEQAPKSSGWPSPSKDTAQKQQKLGHKRLTTNWIEKELPIRRAASKLGVAAEIFVPVPPSLGTAAQSVWPSMKSPSRRQSQASKREDTAVSSQGIKEFARVEEFSASRRNRPRTAVRDMGGALDRNTASNLCGGRGWRRHWRQSPAVNLQE